VILHPQQLDTAALHGQICVVGAGAVGISLALALAEAKVDVILIAGGGYEESAADRKIHRGVIDPAGSHEPLEDNRHRAFGGATKRWGGRLVPYDAIDLETRPYIPLSGWPISYQELRNRYAIAMSLCEVEPNEFRQPPDLLRPDLAETLGGGSIETTACERWSPPTDFGVAYRAVLASDAHVRVLLDYHAVNIRLDDDLTRVESIQVVARGGRTISVSADVFVLAAGGLENPRLLLASRGQIERGVGNHSDFVGRCYMGHLSGQHGSLRLKSGRRKPAFYRFRKDRAGAYCRRRFRLSDGAQRELQIGNVIGFPMRPEIHDSRHRDAVLSFLYLVEAASGANRGALTPRLLMLHARNCILNSPLAWISIANQLWLRSRSPRLPFILPHAPEARDALFFQAEHAPHPESRVTLCAEADEFGMPRLRPQMRFSDVDRRTVLEFYRRLDRALRSSDQGYVEYDETGLNAHLDRIMSRYNSFAHHIGTTRMSADPSAGVVDADCRVHSVRNLYVGGASVFPTSGHANPTLTALALASRLADHLIARCAAPAILRQRDSAEAAGARSGR
jgi:choline dehydrogenase-like flavoprotein